VGPGVAACSLSKTRKQGNGANRRFTPNRRFSLKINIKYDQDLMKAKQVLEAIMIEDPRVLSKPRPVVYLMSLEKGYMELQGLGWVESVKAICRYAGTPRKG
jgi:small-conductance mechanosensitive channel